jgi:hypothetical protein
MNIGPEIASKKFVISSWARLARESLPAGSPHK